jgi:serpin B
MKNSLTIIMLALLASLACAQKVVKAGDKTYSNLPIPKREITRQTTDQSIEELGLVKAQEGDPVISNENNPRVLVSLTDEEQALVMPVNDLGFNLFRKVGASESILLSPLGMTFALGLIGNGAAGKTRTQINQVLGCDDKKAANINEFCRKMLTEAPRIDRLSTIDITNDFFSPKSFTLKPAFKEVAIDNYDTKFKESESDLLKYTLVNTIYFKGIWTDKFRKVNTYDEVFRGEDGKERAVPMMNQLNQFFYTENDLCQTLCLPYSNGAYQMVVLLPKGGKTVREVAQSLTADSWKKMYDQMRRIDVDVKLPRFESSSEVNLTGVMSDLMPNAFNMKKADFSNLFDIESCIDKIKQKGRIKVDETGAVATVATFLQGDLGSVKIVKPETIRFHATHPFLYFIREWSTGAIFFIGQYMGT